MNDDTEVRLRCLEAAARNPFPHPDGFAAGVLAAARAWAEWVNPPGGINPPGKLGLPKKLV